MKKIFKLLLVLGISTPLSWNVIACSGSGNSSTDIPTKTNYYISFKGINKISISNNFLRFTLNKSDTIDANNLPSKFWLNNNNSSTDLNARETGVLDTFASIYGFTLNDNWQTINNKLNSVGINNVFMTIRDWDNTMWDLIEISIKK